ncbi:unnamed protein product [Clavelina lepadiformis]|uniref:Uncharacterized protein n=1 Tax=Clavelina lepadiformis TaxID=159417 RepID=A0ABP0GKW9_CLALP
MEQTHPWLYLPLLSSVPGENSDDDDGEYAARPRCEQDSTARTYFEKDEEAHTAVVEVICQSETYMAKQKKHEPIIENVDKAKRDIHREVKE